MKTDKRKTENSLQLSHFQQPLGAECANGVKSFVSGRGLSAVTSKPQPVAVTGGAQLARKPLPPGALPGPPASADGCAPAVATSAGDGHLLTSNLSVNTKVADAPAVCYSPRPPPSALIQVVQ